MIREMVEFSKRYNLEEILNSETEPDLENEEIADYSVLVIPVVEQSGELRADFQNVKFLEQPDATSQFIWDNLKVKKGQNVSKCIGGNNGLKTNVLNAFAISALLFNHTKNDLLKERKNILDYLNGDETSELKIYESENKLSATPLLKLEKKNDKFDIATFNKEFILQILTKRYTDRYKGHVDNYTKNKKYTGVVQTNADKVQSFMNITLKQLAQDTDTSLTALISEHQFFQKERNKFKYCDLLVLFKLADENIQRKLVEERNKLNSIGKIDGLVYELCSCCGEKTECNYFSRFCSFGTDKSKIYNRTAIGCTGVPSPICPSCINYCQNFIEVVEKFKIKFFPLFIDYELQLELRKKLLTKEGKNFFSDVFERLPSNETYNFYLVIFNNGKLPYFDYVFNYSWKINGVLDFSRGFENTYSANRQTIESYFKKALGVNSFNYFADLKDSGSKGLDKPFKLNKRKLGLFLQYRKIIFDWVYRARTNFTENMILDYSVNALEISIRENSEEFTCIYAALTLWFNRHIFKGSRGEKMETVNELTKLRSIKIELEKGKEKEECENTEWAYLCGILYQHLVSLSARSNKQGLMLEPIVTAHTVTQVKKVLTLTLERYQHAISTEVNDPKKKKQIEILLKIISPALMPNSKVWIEEFNSLKPYFYAGYFDSLNDKRNLGGSD